MKRLRIVGESYAHARIYIDDMDISDLVSDVRVELSAAKHNIPNVVLDLQPARVDVDIPAIAHISAHAGDVDIVAPALAKLVAQVADLNRQIKEASEQLVRLQQDDHE